MKKIKVHYPQLLLLMKIFLSQLQTVGHRKIIVCTKVDAKSVTSCRGWMFEPKATHALAVSRETRYKLVYGAKASM